MNVAWAPVRMPGRWRRRVPGFEDMEVGNAILSRWPQREVTICELDGPPRLDEAPLAVSATVECPAGDLRFACTHLTSEVTASTTRVCQVTRLAEHLTARRANGPWPLVTVGDFNAEPDSDEIRRLGGYLTTPAVPSEVFIDAWRYHDGHGSPWTLDRNNPHVRATGEPSARVDYIFLSPNPGVGGASVDMVSLFGNTPRDSQWPSDHAGVYGRPCSGWLSRCDPTCPTGPKMSSPCRFPDDRGGVPMREVLNISERSLTRMKHAARTSHPLRQVRRHLPR